MKSDTIINESEIRRLEDYLLINSMRDYVIFKIGTNLGLRVSDFLDPAPEKREGLRKEGKEDYYTVGYFRNMCNRGMVRLTQQKTSKPVEFEIPADIKRLILDYTADRDDREPMFKSRFEGKAFTRVGFFLVLKDAAGAVGIKNVNVSCHTMRKIFGYFHYKKYKDIRQLMAIFNHSKEEVTLKYIGINQEEINKNMRSFRVGDFKTVDDIDNKDELLEAKKKMLEAKKTKKHNNS